MAAFTCKHDEKTRPKMEWFLVCLLDSNSKRRITNFIEREMRVLAMLLTLHMLLKFIWFRECVMLPNTQCTSHSPIQSHSRRNTLLAVIRQSSSSTRQTKIRSIHFRQHFAVCRSISNGSCNVSHCRFLISNWKTTETILSSIYKTST